MSLFLLMTACGGSDDEDDGFTSKEGKLTVSPLQNISVGEGNKTSVSVSAQFTGYKTALTYTWTCKDDDLGIIFEGLDTDTVSFTAPEVSRERYVFCYVQVGVEEGIWSGGIPGSNRAIITIQDLDPKASAGDDQILASGKAYLLSGSNTNNNIHISTISWQQVSGLEVQIKNADAYSASFIAPVVAVESELVFEFSLISQEGKAAKDTVSITVLPAQPPTLSINYPQQVNEQSQVTLDARGSFDDLSISSYQWSQVSGVAVAIDNATSSQLHFTSPKTSELLTLQFELTLTDATQLTISKVIDIEVLPVNESPVIAIIGPDAVDEQLAVSLDASSSFDEDGQVV
ncbi:MAG: hypothetical protein HRU20_24370, partial [Pseudomonadales bacterium]|nr:hypothetical protein [Pseudomonadales bacterium]